MSPANNTQSLEQTSSSSGESQQATAWIDTLNTKIEKTLEDKIEQSIQSKIEEKIEHDLFAKLEEKIQGNLDQKISKTFEKSLQKIDATVSTVASSFSNLNNMIAKKSQDTPSAARQDNNSSASLQAAEIPEANNTGTLT